MRTKTLLLTAALSAVTVASAMAQTPVYSVNAVGYVNVTVPPGKFALLANPLNQPTNDLASVLPDVPVGTIVYTFDPNSGAFAGTFTKRTSSWSGTGAADARLNPGSGFFVKNAGATDMTITFVGEVPQGTNTITFPKAGFYLIGSIVPQAGKLETDLKMTAVNGDKVYLFDNATQGYTTLTRRATSWSGGTGEPAVGVAQGFFYQATAAGAWTRVFSVNQ